ncbi:MAG: hypothetical protein HY077_11380 [Elusimicrobia bacterium]|nr:hypothetical protein [Elusimicrobiota bacterium]
MRRALAAAAVLALTGCGLTFRFDRKMSNEELILRDEVRAYYSEVAAAFAAGNGAALAGLFAPGISHPMTKEQIEAWGDDFFAKHGPAGFKVEKLEFEKVGHVSAEVVLTYRVETRDKAGSFGGVERDRLVKRGRRWSVASWDKLP